MEFQGLPFAEETPPAREVLAQSRTMKGGGTAGVATLGAAGVEAALEVLAETQSAILPLVPYLDTLRWVFIAVALGGIAVTATPASMIVSESGF
jgi:zinc D-Ala-D-Ala carboxypeptidase